jgi:2-(1,2-epoxy-1,2-dihydrophenyl)acetyl-CoA isomerase
MSEDVPGPYRSTEGVRVQRKGPLLEFVLDRPEKRNALTDPIVAAMLQGLSAAGPDESVRVILIRGAGDHFCAGFDIVGRNAGDERPRVGSIQRRLPTEAHRLIDLILTTQTPIVCQVQGWAAGIGLHVVLAADFALVDESARLWEPYAQRGFTPDTGGTWLLARRVGEVRAREMLLLGEGCRAPTPRPGAWCTAPCRRTRWPARWTLWSSAWPRRPP